MSVPFFMVIIEKWLYSSWQKLPNNGIVKSIKMNKFCPAHIMQNSCIYFTYFTNNVRTCNNIWYYKNKTGNFNIIQVYLFLYKRLYRRMNYTTHQNTWMFCEFHLEKNTLYYTLFHWFWNWAKIKRRDIIDYR